MGTSVASTNQILDQLDRVTADQPVVVSCYVRLDVEHRQRKRYLTAIRQRARAVIKQLEAIDVERAALQEVRADLDRILDWLSQPSRLPGLPGVALFACDRLDLFEVVPLGRVHRNRVTVGRRPALLELFDAQETLDRYLTVLLDRQHARFFAVAADGAEELAGVASPSPRGGRFRPDRRDAPGWGERQYHNRIASEKHRHYEATAEELARLARAERPAGIAVMGPAEHTAGLLDFLPHGLRERLMGTARLNPTVDEAAAVAEATWLLQAAWERSDEETLVQAVETGGATGWARNGIRDTLSALAKGQVRVLVVPEGEESAGFRCATSGRLVASARHCRGEGDPEPVPNLIDAAIDEALGQRSEVRVIDEPALARRIDGLAALLRFRTGR
jgi:peptide subunit release factor 1 (eRF1)